MMFVGSIASEGIPAFQHVDNTTLLLNGGFLWLINVPSGVLYAA